MSYVEVKQAKFGNFASWIEFFFFRDDDDDDVEKSVVGKKEAIRRSNKRTKSGYFSDNPGGGEGSYKIPQSTYA